MDTQTLKIARQYRADLKDLNDNELWEKLENYEHYASELYLPKFKNASHLIEDDMQCQLFIQGLGALIGFGFIGCFDNLEEEIQHMVDFHEKKAFDTFLKKSYEVIKFNQTPHGWINFLNDLEFGIKIDLQFIVDEDNLPKIIHHKLTNMLEFASNSKDYLITKIQYPQSLLLPQTALQTIDQPQRSNVSLWDLFLDHTQAKIVKNKLISAGHLTENEDSTVSFITKGKQIKSEPASLYQALIFLQYVENMDLSYTKTKELLKNTFKGFTCNEQAIAKGFRHKNVEFFRALCKIS